MEVIMKKTKIAILALLAIASIGLLTGCGDAKTDDTGSSTDSGANNEQSSGVIEEIVTDAADGIKDLGDDIKNGVDGGTNGNGASDGNLDNTNGNNTNGNNSATNGATTNDSENIMGTESSAAQQ